MERYTILEPSAPEIDDAPELLPNIVLATDRQTAEVVAIKRLEIVADKATCRVDEHVAMERRIHKHVKKVGGHTNILRLRDSFQMQGVEHLVTDHCARGSLFDVLKATTDKRFDVATGLMYVGQIADGLVFLRSLGYAHCDLSLENILVDETNTCKLCDFGHAADASVKQTAVVGKYFYMAPELYDGRGYDASQTDVWSLGILLFIMVTGVAPFRQARVLDDHFELFKQRGLAALCDHLSVNQLIPDDVFDLLDAMLQIHPSTRATIKDVVAAVGHSNQRHSDVSSATSEPTSPTHPIMRRKLSMFQKVLDPFKASFQRSKYRSTF
ncbi:serine/threonine protein kinase [Aphanomyces invadans]|uniref:Serine/threonine protein kinase n=1 Tax=Aphanomyces invadans TaxID=157072 RepID=A0A024U367_9STRA|nr:serine/threonine protein kinase [Aphanomyces invadans]ETW00670.1 serine/threonine protein kinase [Aphanomyces invadans]|eukprot:XP_008870805.1 serine/threonine protein kinase [Aphanomyces invadans]